jgi:hypothetical protein
MLVYSFTQHTHYDMFRPVIVAIIGKYNNYTEVKNWATGLSSTSEYTFIILLLHQING